MIKVNPNAVGAEPAFKGSEFTAQEYMDVWGDDWYSLFMRYTHDPELDLTTRQC